MNRISLKTAAVLTAASMALFACNPPNSGNVVSSSQAQAAQTVNFGTVIGGESGHGPGRQPAGQRGRDDRAAASWAV